MKLPITLLTLTSIILTAFSCSKTNNPSKNATLHVNLKHHEIAHNLINCTVYIKYNTSDLPANGIYDDSAVASNQFSDTMQTAVFTHLANENYFLYGKGFDTSIHSDVKGGQPITISTQAVQTTDLAVSE